MRDDPHARLALMTGAWETARSADTTGVVRFGTTAWTDLDHVVVARPRSTVLTADGRTVYLFEVPCYGAGTPTTRCPNAAIRDASPRSTRSTRTSPARCRKVQIVHWRTLVCPGGHRAESVGGVRLWQPDDQHLSADGAVVVWKWWLPQLRADG